MAAQPPRGHPVQARELFGQPAAQFEPEQVGEQMVIPEPGPARIERDDEGISGFEVEEDSLSGWLTGEQAGQLTVDRVER